jgi:predicted nucleic acid-binding protein
MTTAVDTNVIVALWDRDPSLSSAAQSALDAALGRGTLVVAATVFAELMAAPSRSELFLDSFFRETGINIDWALDESVWRTAGRAFQGYAARRRKQRDVGPRRILADFLIGAHAQEGGHSLLTLDDHLYRTAFPALTVVRV